MRDHVIVCGYGRMGRVVCEELAAKPASFVVVDRDPEAVRDAERAGHPCVAGDATEDDVLTAAGIERASGLVAALLTDADNVYVVLSARELNSRLSIVARAEDERSERKLLHAGATRVVCPYAIGGYRMAHALLRPAMVDVIDLVTQYRHMDLQIEEIEITPAGYGEGRTLAASRLREDLGLIVVAIQRGGEMLFNPGGETRLVAGDRLVLMGHADNVRELERRFRA
jgi:voltage-gated potassium channel